ncbi:multifunctional 2-keto-3-deoxygluconate 6-phosphate aldolase and 2-keto-4-hydroxyglutarate aldolase and oxaloacetate decarboxylase [Methylocella tundrae]|uniref:2-dehydro-3-deoxy-phosphogluconate aldolase n=1 Tax=Methylocella tundrae TaxID=227605 RepID=A0A8B6M866_METTU|nr:bifunctional 4-hydroxy-2-oxoglutarate aldolase/2-dehydro-3-deoxy-phosphogluconate aldolase [Methylocella tundrae]VTZ50987.1 multifunctional 2-keto-3-deoxygluconate 6-phosphate aldolase and 2-keto-4-hydroxyglutarate aldolase and oxaloacetate decarboxylase [Methylocella tundrae]
MQYQHTDATLALMKQAPVIPVMQVADAADALAQAKSLIGGGLTVLEITLRTKAALKSIEMLTRAFPEAIIGAGTVTDADQMEAAIDAGAAFLVSPGMTRRLLKAARKSPIPWLPGVATASEAMTLHEHGFRCMKFFPAEAAGGVKYLSSLAGPLQDLVFCPTGGINPEKAKAYLELSNVACVGGSWMVAPALINAGDYAAVERLAKEACALRAPV